MVAFNVVLLTANLSRRSAGLAASVPGLARSVNGRGCFTVCIMGLRDPHAPEAWREWGQNVYPHAQVGPPAFGWSPRLKAGLSVMSPDLVHAQGLWMYPSKVSRDWHRKTGRPIMISPRGMLEPWARERRRWKKALVRKWFEDEHLARANCIHATAESEAKNLRHLGLRGPIAIVPNGVDVPVNVSRRPTSRRPKRLLFLSRIHPKKGLDHLVRAWARLERRHPEWELVLAGPDEAGHRQEIQALVSELGVGSLVWKGPVYGQVKADLYQSADLFVLPTRSENFGLVLAEALAHGVAAITTTGAPWEGLRDNRCGWWVELSDEDLFRALSEAMTLPEGELKAMGERGRAWVSQAFGWPAIGRQMASVYEWVLGGGSPPPCVMTD